MHPGVAAEEFCVHAFVRVKSPDAGAGPRDSLMLAIKRTTGVSIRVARGGIEVTVVTLGWLLGGPAGIGTVIFALLIGTFVQWGFRLLKVEPHKDQ